MNVKVASAQCDIGFLKNWQDYKDKTEHWVRSAAAQNAQILLFPEYASMELASLFPKPVYKSLNKQLHSMQTVLDDYLNLFQGLAQKYRCHIQAGTFPVKIERGQFRNRAYLFYQSQTRWFLRFPGKTANDPF